MTLSYATDTPQGRTARLPLGFRSGLAIVAAFLLGALFAARASAVPVHAPEGSITGLDHACGAATDSEGDLYLSSAGSSEVRIYDSGRTPIGSIGNLNGPCGLAVDTDGNVYVSESTTGRVVRYKPTSYPFSGTPIYEPPEEIDSSGDAKGISVDPFDDRLYVAEGGKVLSYGPSGALGIDEVQQLTINQTTGGTFRLALPGEGGGDHNEIQVVSRVFEDYALTFDGDTTHALTADASALEVEEALVALSTINPGDIVVTGYDNRDKWVEFTGSLANEDVPLIEGTGDVTATAVSDMGAPITYGASSGTVQSELEALDGIGLGDIQVENQANGYRFTFKGALAHTDVPNLFANPSGLTPDSGFNPEANMATSTQGWSGIIGEGDLVEATGVASYTYRASATRKDRYLFVADASDDEVKTFGGSSVKALDLRKAIDGSSTPNGSFDFGAQGAYVAVDQGTCPPVGQACTAGHVFVYDAGHEVVDEFEAGGRFLDQIENPAFEEGAPTAIVIDRSEASSRGTVWVTAGAAGGAKALAFGPLPPPSRGPAVEPPEHSLALTNACGAAIDSAGNRYVAADNFIHVYPPTGGATSQIALIEDPAGVCEIAVDGMGRVYALDDRGSSPGSGRIVYFTPNEYPPEESTTYSPPTMIADTSSTYFPTNGALQWFALNPANDHVFVTQFNRTIELDSVDNGAGILDVNVGPTVGSRSRLAVDETTGNLFMVGASGHTTINVLEMGEEGNPDDERVVASMTGVGSPAGSVDGNTSVTLDQGSGHLLIFNSNEGVIEEYEETGTFVMRVGEFKDGLVRPSAIAIDNSGGPNDGYLYAAYYGNEAGRDYEGLLAFGPLAYGEPPQAKTGLASEVGGGNAVLNGTINPRGFLPESCNFEYLSEADYELNVESSDPPFEGGATTTCIESPATIGSGTKPVSVRAQISGLDPEGRYRFRLLAANEFGLSEGGAGIFGPPTIKVTQPKPVSYVEATARAMIDPTGLATRYFVRYGADESYGQSTKAVSLDAEAGTTAVAIHLFGLAEATTYHLRVFAENEAGKAIPAGPDQVITTLQRRPVASCSNQEYRIGRSANLPDCRSYELVTPADTRGATPYAFPGKFNNWLVDPQGAQAGESLAYNTNGTLSGFDGNGRLDGYRATREIGEHPAGGWSSALSSPSYDQAGGGLPSQTGFSPDQEYSFWDIPPLEVTAGVLEGGSYLRTPERFEPIGRGSLGEDLDATGSFLSRGGVHVIFTSKAHLEDAAAPTGTAVIYDRRVGNDEASVISWKPDGTQFGAGEDANFIGTNEDASAIAFSVGGTLYLRRDRETIEVATVPNAFAGVSADGSRIFYVGASVSNQQAPPPAPLFVCELEEGPCAGTGAHPATQIASSGRFVNVAEDGSRVYFTSTEVLDGKSEGGLDQDNLYLWEADSEQIRFIGLLDPDDLTEHAFEGTLSINLIGWLRAVASARDGINTGRGVSPTRSTSDGSVLVFQSHANLTPFDAEGTAQIYRYDSEAEPGEDLVCVSCALSGTSPEQDVTLTSFSTDPLKGSYTTLIPNVTTDGQVVFFETSESLLPEDANDVQDVYEWRAQGSTWCRRQGGCLALISSGHADTDSHLYGMSADGHDVFFSTLERLVGQDVPGSSSIYDARVGGGIPDPPAPAPCQGDSCQGQGAPPPPLPPPASSATAPSQPNAQKPKPRSCPKGKRKVKRKGKVRCVKRRRGKHHRGKSHRGKKHRVHHRQTGRDR